MRERVFGLETEYALVHQGAPSAAVPTPDQIVAALTSEVRASYGLPTTTFLINGARFYADVGHAEWSVPECRSARQAAIHDCAADRVLMSALPGAERRLASAGFPGVLSIIKNNVDSAGHTYGCHENYMAERQTAWLGMEDQLRLTARMLIPFLVSRQVLCGSGRVGWGPRIEEAPLFQIHQRADFLTEILSKDSRVERPIVHVGREGSPLGSGNLRRIHLILADANLSGIATFLKLGTTGILLRMVEDLGFVAIPHLADPLRALRSISRDPTCKRLVSLRDGRRLTAIDLQREYHRQAVDYLARYGSSTEEQELCSLWLDTLDALERDPSTLVGKLDWVTKHALLERVLDRAKAGWAQVRKGEALFFELLRVDVTYHDLALRDRLSSRLLHGAPDALVSAQEMAGAADTPPAHTRARIRGDVVASARRTGRPVRVDRWDEVTIDGHSVPLDDPLAFFSQAVFSLLRGPIASGAKR